jgi:molybdopterin-guanine dinucleotide biosynthesis protein A
MLDRPDTLIIGSAARKAGKTAFAVRVIRRLAARREVIAVKITPLPERGGPPFTHDGCDASEPGCAEPWRIDEEAAGNDRTDTGRMLSAGARKAFWVRARRERLEEAAAELWRRIPPGACVVAEGGSLRRSMKPGLFVLLREPGGEDVKNSYRELLPLADRIGLFDGREWDFPPEDCRFIDGLWRIRPPASAIILAGGGSRRMGRDKALLDFGGRPLIEGIASRLKELFDEIVIGANRPGDYAFLGLPVVPDREPGLGPLMGIASCLERTAEDLAFVTACDIPFLDLGFAAEMLARADGYDMVLPRSGPDAYEPLFAVYRKSVIAPALEILAAGGRRIVDLLGRVRSAVVSPPNPAGVRNINTIEDYLALRRG